MELSIILLLAVAVAVLVWRGSGGGRAAKPEGAPTPDSGPAPVPAPILDPFLIHLYEFQRRVIEGPRVSTAEDLVQVRAFADLADVLADRGIEAERLLSYAAGDDAVLAWASLHALARRPREASIEARLLSRLNAFHSWTRHFTLRVLEAWNPDDPTLAGRVLVRLDESWSGAENGAQLDGFLARRATLGPISLEGVERPAGSDPDVLRQTLAIVDPAIAGPLLDELGPPTRPRGRPMWPGDTGDPGLEDLGRLIPPGGAKDEGLIPYASADERLGRIVAALTATPRRPVLVVGEAGVGKTSLVRRAVAQLSRDGWVVFEAGAAQINAGMTYVGMLEARIQQLRKSLRGHARIVWVVPDFHQLLWAGRASNNPIGILELLIPAIEAGELLILGEVRPPALERVLLERPEVSRLFEVVRLEPPTEDEVSRLLEVWAADAAERRGIGVPAGLRTEAASLARQYLSAETPPGGVLRLMDRAVSEAARRSSEGKKETLTLDHLVEALVQLTGLSPDLLDERRPLDLEAVRKRFASRVIGQPDAVASLVERLALMKAGITDPTRPYGVFLFAGGTGTGKTELAKALAHYLFGSPDRLVRLDMSELMDGRGIERVLGGSTDTGLGGNSLAERVRRQPFCVVLLDEFEKAHARVWDLFLQVFDDGRLTDHRGETADFRHAIIILTSNLGTRDAGEVRVGLVGAADAFSPTAIERAVERTFRPELLNRLDRVVVFRPLTREIMRQILRKELAEAFERRGLRRREWAVEVEESALELLVERGFSPALGARPLRRALERYLLTPLARAIVDRSAPEGDQFLFVRADGDELAVEFVDPDAPAPAAAPPAPAPGDLAAILYDPRGSHAEVERLRGALEAVSARVSSPRWQESKQELMASSGAPGFWERADRFETLGRAEYLDRIESSLHSATSLLERLAGESRGPRPAYARAMVRRLAQQLYLLEAAGREALETGPRDAFVSVESPAEEGDAAGIGREFARRVERMYETWARARGMRWTDLSAEAPGEGGPRLQAVAGFAAYALLSPEDGLHVLEWDDRDGVARRASVRVRVVAQPPAPARDGAAGLRRQALEALAARSASTPAVVRRYRESPSPLVRDGVRGWRTGRIDRVLGGDFDVIPPG